MDCTTWEEKTSALVDGELDDAEASALFLHLASCRSCRDFYGKLAGLKDALHESWWEGLSPGDERPRRSSPSEEKQPPGKTRRVLRVPRPLAVAAAIFLLVAGGSVGAILTKQSIGASSERVIFIGSLPTVEVEASYLTNSHKGL